MNESIILEEVKTLPINEAIHKVSQNMSIKEIIHYKHLFEWLEILNDINNIKDRN